MKSLRCRLGFHCNHFIDYETFEHTAHNGLHTYQYTINIYRCCRCWRDWFRQDILNACPYFAVRVTVFSPKEQIAEYFKDPKSLHQAPKKKIF